MIPLRKSFLISQISLRLYVKALNNNLSRYIKPMFYFLVNSLAWATPTLNTINNAVNIYNSHARFLLPTLNSAQYASLKEGTVVTLLDKTDPDDPQRAIGMLLSPVPAKQLWISCQDSHFSQQSSTTEKRLSLNTDRSAEWYGFMDMPWPFSDRHWLVNVSNNISMAAKTNDACWEHPWDLILGEKSKIYSHLGKKPLANISKEMVDSAIYTPVNKGAWGLIQIEDQNLLVYHATTVVGGSIPTDLVVKLVRTSLNDMLKNIETRALNEVPTHYTDEHSLILGGNGKNIPLFD